MLKNIECVNGLRITIASQIVEDMVSEITRFPTVEVGGKYIGRVHGNISITSDIHWGQQLKNVKIEIIHSIDAGEKAIRTATYHLPDGNYQEKVFREIETIDPKVEHFGTWHSHHPNGYKELSSGDIKGYFETVNDENYNLDFFIASLIFDNAGFYQAKHFLFIRRERTYFEIDSRCFKIEKHLHNPYVSIANKWRQQSFISNDQENFLEWYECKKGQKELAFDQEWITLLLENPQLFSKNKILKWRGTLVLKNISVHMEYEYPRNFPKYAPQLRIRIVYEKDTSDFSKSLSSRRKRKDEVYEIINVLRNFDEALSNVFKVFLESKV